MAPALEWAFLSRTEAVTLRVRISIIDVVKGGLGKDRN
jgi:hypothetical protein